MKRDRDAWATIRGYVYQVDLTIYHWLDLQPGQVLELERGEDIDLVQAAINSSGVDQQRLLGQIKHRDKNITLRSSEAIEALASFYEHTNANPGMDLKFRFITNAQIGKEKLSPIPQKTPALIAWELLRSGQIEGDTLISYLTGIHRIIMSVPKPEGLNEDTWNLWRDFIIKIDENQLHFFIRKVEWSTGNTLADDYSEKIKLELINRGHTASQDEAETIYQRLFLYIFKLLSTGGLKRLKMDQLTIQINLPTLSQSDRTILERLKILFVELKERVDVLESIVQQQQVQVQHLARQMGFNASINYSIYHPFVGDIPPLVDHVINRKDIVNKYLYFMDKGTWVALFGDLGCGKTQLAILIAKSLGTCKAWIRLRGLKPTEACYRIDTALYALSKIEVTANWRDWLSKICTIIGNGALIVLDDLPRTIGGDILNERLVVLAEICAAHNIKILSTSPNELHMDVKDFLNDQLLLCEEIPRLNDSEILQVFEVFGAPGDFLTEKLLTFAFSLTKGHPSLVTAMTRYLSSCNWKITEKELDGLIKGKFADELNLNTHSMLMATVNDPESRMLLYRLNLIGSSFTFEDVRQVSRVIPSISLPLEKINNSIGLWIQRDNNTTFLTSPLLSHLGSGDLSEETKRGTHAIVGASIIRKQVLDPLDTIRAISHFCSAEDYNKAGIILFMALKTLYENNINVDGWGITNIWFNMPLPEQMDLDTRLLLRSIQIIVCERLGKNVNRLLENLDNLIKQASEENTLGVMGAVFYAGMLRAEADLRAANRYFLKAMTIFENKELESTFAFPAPTASFIWVNIIGIKSFEDLRDWISTFEKLSPNQRKTAYECDIAEDGCINVCDKIWLLEVRKQKNERDWDKVLSALSGLEEFSIRHDLELLWACAIRARIIVLAEYKENLDGAQELANEAIAIASGDPRVQFIIRGIIGCQYVYTKRWPKAIPWLNDALAQKSDSYPLERINILLRTSEAVGDTDPGLAVDYTGQAVHIAKNSVKISETMLVKVLGEHTIAIWMAGNLKNAYSPWQEATERLFACKNNEDSWKALFMIFGHVSGYLSSIAAKGIPLQYTSDGEEYFPPTRGIFLQEHSSLSILYKGSRDWGLSAQLAMFAEAMGDDEQTAKWALKAYDMALESDVGSLHIIGFEAIPHLIMLNRYTEVLDLALEVGTMMVAIDIEKTNGGNPHRSNFNQYNVLGPKPNDAWAEAENKAAMISLIYILLRIGTLKFTDPVQASTLATTVANLCRQIADDSSCGILWNTASELFENIFNRQVSSKELIEKGNELATTLKPLQIICYIGGTFNCIPEQAIQLHLATFSYLQSQFKDFYSFNRLIMIPFIKTYWNITFQNTKFRFRYPGLVEPELKQALNAPVETVIQHVLKCIAFGLGFTPDKATKDWLNTY